MNLELCDQLGVSKSLAAMLINATVIKKAGITTWARMQVFLAIAAKPGIENSELSEVACETVSGASAICFRLENSGLITSKLIKANRRGKGALQHRLSPKGEKLLEKLTDGRRDA